MFVFLDKFHLKYCNPEIDSLFRFSFYSIIYRYHSLPKSILFKLYKLKFYKRYIKKITFYDKLKVLLKIGVNVYKFCFLHGKFTMSWISFLISHKNKQVCIKARILVENYAKFKLFEVTIKQFVFFLFLFSYIYFMNETS